MRLTKTTALSGETPVPPIFYKATSSGVQTCYIVDNCYNPEIDEEGLDIETVEGYVVDGLFVRIREEKPDIDLAHFDQPQNAFFTTEEEATAFHRELVLNYIKGLNASSLKSHPIEAA